MENLRNKIRILVYNGVDSTTHIAVLNNLPPTIMMDDKLLFSVSIFLRFCAFHPNISWSFYAVKNRLYEYIHWEMNLKGQ